MATVEELQEQLAVDRAAEANAKAIYEAAIQARVDTEVELGQAYASEE